MRKKGDRRGLNPRQPEPQSLGNRQLSNTCEGRRVNSEQVVSRSSEDENTRCRLAIGRKVRIIRGLAVGVEGVVIERWATHFGDQQIALWRIGSNDLVRSRVMRADHLEVIGP